MIDETIFRIAGQLDRWDEANENLGQAFDSSTGFILPNGATRSPNASWVSQARWDALPPEQKGSIEPSTHKMPHRRPPGFLRKPS